MQTTFFPFVCPHLSANSPAKRWCQADKWGQTNEILAQAEILMRLSWMPTLPDLPRRESLSNLRAVFRP